MAPTLTALTEFQSGHGFVLTSGGGSIADDTAVYDTGTQSLKIITKGDASTQIRVTASSISPTMDIDGKYMAVRFRYDTAGNPNTTGQFFIGVSSNNFSDYAYFSATYQAAHGQADTWLTVGWSPSDWNVSGSPDLSAINSLRIYARDNPAAEVTFNMQGIYSWDAAQAGIVSFVFDDGHETVYDEALSTLGTLPATVCPVSNLIGTGAYLTHAELHELQDEKGWDVSVHGGTDLTTMSLSEQTEELHTNRAIHVANGYRKGLGFLPYPNGNYDANTISLMPSLFASGRQSSTSQHETLPPLDYYRLKAFPVRHDTTTGEVATEVTNAIDNKDWLILVFHRLVTPADEATEVTPADFTTIVNNISSSGIAVRTVSEVLGAYPSPAARCPAMRGFNR